MEDLELQELLAERSRRDSLNKSPIMNQNSQRSETNTDDQELQELLAEKERRVGHNNNKGFNSRDRVIQGAHGLASLYETLSDIGSKYILSPAIKHQSTYGPQNILPSIKRAVNGDMNVNPQSEGLVGKATNYLENSPAEGLLTKPIEKRAGKALVKREDGNIAPPKKDTLGNIIHTGVQFAAPLPLPGGGGLLSAVKQGIKSLSKYVGKEAVIAGTTATALETTPSFTKEGTIGRGAEDLAKVIIGGIAGRKLSGKAGEIASDINKLASQGRFKETIKSIPSKIAGKTLSTFAKPNEEVLGLASKHGIELPANVGMGSTPLNWLANNYNKSIFASEAYKKVIQNADEQMIKKLNDSIDLWGDSHLKPSDASKQFRMFLEQDEKRYKTVVDKLYDFARKELKPSDTVATTNTRKSLTGALDILDRDVKSPGTKKVVSILADLAEKWGMVPDNQKIRSFANGSEIIDENALKKIFGKSSNVAPVLHVGRLDDVAKELRQIINHDPNAQGAKGFIKRLIGDIEKDIGTSQNEKYLSYRGKANKFYKDNMADRFKTELAQSILHGEAPIEAFSKMNNVENIKLFEQIAGKSKKGKQIFNQLKQAKLREILETATTSGGLEKGSVGTAKLSSLFNKKEGRQEVIEALLPNKKAYNDLSEIATIAEEFSKSGRELLNTSGSTLVKSDYDRVMRTVKEGFKVLFGQVAVGGAAGVTLGPLSGAAVGMAGPWLTSKLMSNPKIITQARAYALARSKGQDKYAETILKRMVEMATPEAKNVLIQAENSIDKGNKSKDKEKK